MVILSLLFTLLAAVPATGVELYKYSAAAGKSPDYAVTIAGQEVTVLQTDRAQIAQFGADGEVELTVTLLGDGELLYADIRPMGKGYEYEMEGRTLRLKLKTYDRVSVEINGDKEKPLFIFVNPLEETVADNMKGRKGILYFKAGSIYPLKRLDLKDSEGLYIEGGAIVKAAVVATDLAGLSIGGCGILDCRTEGGHAIKLSGCSKVSMDNLCILNSALAGCLMTDCSDVTMKNVKAVNVGTENIADERPAFDWTGCRRVCASQLFAYSQSRALHIHNKYFKEARPVENIVLEDCVAWNAKTSSTLGITCSDDCSIKDISIKGFHAIHSAGSPKPYYRAVLSIQQSGSKKLSGLDITDFTAEDPGEYLFCILGWITDVTITDFKALSKAPYGATLRGADFDHRVENLTFDNFTIGRKKIRTLKQAGVKNPGLGLNIIFK